MNEHINNTTYYSLRWRELKKKIKKNTSIYVDHPNWFLQKYILFIFIDGKLLGG